MAKSKAKSRAPALSFYPLLIQLTKPALAIGKQASVIGKYWHSCPASDKDKRFKCTIVEFKALHDFGEGVKGAGFLLKEMGIDSLAHPA